MPEDFKPHIGKNVIETLTLGMYDDSRFVFREYVQNAADQIDIAFEKGILNHKSDGKIKISINPEAKTIFIEDNATGINSKEVLRFLGDVANSSKDREQRKGFRGIGRLGGLGYCDKLIFETSAMGEQIKSVMSLDAKLLRQIINDSSDNMDASSVISVITSVSWEKEDEAKHYFKITLVEVSTPRLLDVESVKEYLSMVAPLPFRKDFKFTEEIKSHFRKNNYSFDEYYVEVNTEEIFKSYKNIFEDENGTSDLIGVDFFDVRDDQQDLLALGWFGYRNLSNVVLPVQNKERGIRLRKNNIALGDESTLSRFFKAERTNLRFIGEVHAISNSFIPNARRDYFNDNKTCQTFEEKLKILLEAENLENRLAQTASMLHNRLKDIEAFKFAKNEFESKKGNFDSEKAEKDYIDNLKVAESRAQNALKAISKIHQTTFKDKTVGKLYETIIADKDLTIPNAGNIVLNKYDPPTFAKLKKNESEVVIEIFNLIDETLKSVDAAKLKKLILERFN
jgi:molecular chaperone HtpG